MRATARNNVLGLIALTRLNNVFIRRRSQANSLENIYLEVVIAQEIVF
jgi:hypothetical protein